MLNLTKKLFKFPWKFCLCRHVWINQWFDNKSCLQWWPISLSQKYRPRLTTFDLFHTTILKITKEIFLKICWQLKTPIPTWKCTRCIMQMSYLYGSAFLAKTFANSLNMQKQSENIVWKKSNEAYPLSIRVETTKPYFDLSLLGMNVKENVFFFSARVQKDIAWHIDPSSVVWTLINNKGLRCISNVWPCSTCIKNELSDRM